MVIEGARRPGPQGTGTPETATPAPVRSLRSGPRMSGRKERILVVEDEYFVALDTRDTLRDAGYDVVGVVARGEEALVAAAELAPLLTVIDITLAGRMDGIETAIELKRRGLRVIFATAHTDRELLARGQEAQPLGWLTKPFGEDMLLRAVAEALRQLGH